jgi:rod shape-determining protein MreB
LNRGLYLAGGGALLAGFGKRLASATGIPVHLVENPERCAVAGAALCMATMGYSAESVSRRRW